MFLVAFFLALHESSGRHQPPAERSPCLFLYFRLKLEPEILDCQILNSVCYRVLLILCLTEKSDLQQQVAAL